jgi:drug/metabolite transporter (DMT)-like permease
VRLERLTRGHVLAAVAALVLLLIMAMDWYGSHRADQARQIESQANTRGGEAGEVGRAVQQDAQAIIARDEKNAWQEKARIDRVLLVLLLLTVAAALVAAALRADGRRYKPPWTPAALVALLALVTGLLVAYRIIQQPGPNSETTVKIGPVLAICALALIGFGSAMALQKEVEWASLRESASSDDEY